MGFPLLATIGSALISKALSGGGQQQAPDPIFQFQRRLRTSMTPQNQPFPLRGVNPADAALASSPIIQAMETNQPASEQPKKQGEDFDFKDQFLSSLTQGLVQRLLFGGGQSGYSYAPPTFR